MYDQLFKCRPQRFAVAVNTLLTTITCSFVGMTYAAETASFADQCQEMAMKSKFSIAFEDVQLVRDNTRNLDELRRLSQLTPSPYHFVYGLTRAQAKAEYEIHPVMLTGADGSICATPSILVKIGLSELTVYLAKELINPCKRAAVDDHEQEHVNTWRSHLRAGTRLFEPVLRRSLMRPFYFTRADEVQPGLKRQIDAVLGPLLDNLQKGITANHGEIDSPYSYRITSQRLGACP